MRKLLVLIGFLSLTIIYSCSKSDSVVDPGSPNNASFTMIDSTRNSYIYDVAMADENNVYFTQYVPGIVATISGFKISNGVKTKVTAVDALVLAVDALNTNNYAYAGITQYGAQPYLYIYTNGFLSSVLLDTKPKFPKKMKIMESGEIVVALDSAVCVYHSGIVSKYPINGSVHVNAIAGVASKIDIAGSTDAGTQYVYRIESNAISLLETSSAGISGRKTSVGNYLVKQTTTGGATTFAYLNGVTWTPLFSTNTAAFNYFTGESISSIFLPGTPSYVWNGTVVSQDAATLPSRISQSSISAVSNTRSSTYFIGATVYSSDTTTYIYRRK